MFMSVSDAVRMSLKKARKSQLDLSRLWGNTPQAMSNKFRLERWTGAELARIAAFTGGKLAFIYPDGQQILIDTTEHAGESEERFRTSVTPAAWIGNQGK